MPIISEKTVREVLHNNSFTIKSLKTLTGGSNHFVFACETLEGNELIIKFPRIRETELAFSDGNKDTLFGGELSLKREAYLFDLIRDAGLPTPGVYGVYPTAQGDCIIVERSPGCNMMDYLMTHNHSLKTFLELMENLGTDFKKLHKTSFPSFGNIMVDSIIEPSGFSNFADRYLSINDMILSRCLAKGGLSKEEHFMVKEFFDRKFELYRHRLDIRQSQARLVITDMHGDNFFVENNKCSGYFDVESSQSAPAEFELYSFRFFVFNYYSEFEFKLAQKHFWSAYTNGASDAPEKETDELIDFFSACRLLEIFQSYWGHRDGLRDTWGERIKRILFTYIESNKLDYIKLGSIWRERDQQPLHAHDDRPFK